MRILMISEHASPLSLLGGIDSGGQNVYVANVARQLALRGMKVDIATRREDTTSPPVVHIAPHVRVLHIPAGPPELIRKEELLPYMDEFADFCTWLCKSKDYDLVHANFFMSGFVGLRLKRRLGLPLVVTFHALGKVRRLHQKEADSFPEHRFEIEDTLVREADALIAECPQDRDDMMQLYGANALNISIIPCGHDPFELMPLSQQTARLRLDIPRKRFVALQLGRLVPRKGFDTVIEGFGHFVSQTRADAQLLVVGGDADQVDPTSNPELARLRQVAEQAGVGEQVVFTGRRRRSELRYYYSAANVFLSTPWYEPFGMTPVEAMACGAAVIGSKVGGIKSTIVHGETGLLVPPRDPIAVSRAIDTLYKNRLLCRRLGESGRERAARFYTWSHVASMTERLYESVRLVRPHRVPRIRVKREHIVAPFNRPLFTVLEGGRGQGARPT